MGLDGLWQTKQRPVTVIGAGPHSQDRALFPLAETAHPYFVPQQAVLLYLCTPLVVASAGLLFLGTGLFLALARGGGKDVPTWVLSALALSTVVLSVAPASSRVRPPVRRDRGLRTVPFLLYIVALYGGLLALSEHNVPRSCVTRFRTTGIVACRTRATAARRSQGTTTRTGQTAPVVR